MRPANGKKLVLIVEDVNMAERVGGDQSACEVARELVTQGGWVFGKECRKIRDQMLLATITERRGQQVTKRLTCNLALIGLELPTTESFTQIFKVYIDLLSMKWGGESQ